MRTSFVCWLAVLGGCFVMPPIRGSVGGGGAVGDVVIRNSSGEMRRHDAAGAGQLRIAATPMLLGERAEARRVDLSFGWQADRISTGGTKHDVVHSFFVESAWFLRPRSPARHQWWRFGPTAHMELGVENDHGGADLGVGGGAGFLVEYADWVTDDFTGGGWRGEMALGLAVRGGLRHYDSGTYGFATLSLEFRLPGIAAFTFPLPNHRSR